MRHSALVAAPPVEPPGKTAGKAPVKPAGKTAGKAAGKTPGKPARKVTSREGLIARITETSPAVRRVFEVRPRPDERSTWMSLTAHQLEALAALAGESLTMRELCEHLDISESAGTALSDRLVAHGMVARQADPADRRVVRLSLSDEARETVERFQALKRQRIAEALSVLDDEELAILARIHDRLIASGQCATRSGRYARADGTLGEHGSEGNDR